MITRERPVVLTPSKMALVGRVLDGGEPDGGKRECLWANRDMQIGLIAHEIALLGRIWQLCLPKCTKDYERVYQANLKQLIPIVLSTHPNGEVKKYRRILERMAMPDVSNCDRERATIYNQIARTVMEWAYEKPPFTDTCSFDDERQHINPAEFGKIWNMPDKREGLTAPEKVFKIAQTLKTLQNSGRAGGLRIMDGRVVGGEIRVTNQLKGVIFCARLDDYGQLPGGKRVVTDYKTGDPKPLDNNQHPNLSNAEALARWLIVQAVARMPNNLPTDTRAITVTNSDPVRAAQVTLNYVGIGGSTPEKVTYEYNGLGGCDYQDELREWIELVREFPAVWMGVLGMTG